MFSGFFKKRTEVWIIRMRRAGIKQKDVAKKLGVTTSAVSQVLSGKFNASINALDRYEKVITALEKKAKSKKKKKDK